jgi:hypothetical protein
MSLGVGRWWKDRREYGSRWGWAGEREHINEVALVVRVLCCFRLYFLEILSGSMSEKDLAGRHWVAVWPGQHWWLSHCTGGACPTRAGWATYTASNHLTSRKGLTGAASRGEVPSTSNVLVVGWTTRVKRPRVRVRSICHQPLYCWGGSGKVQAGHNLDRCGSSLVGMVLFLYLMGCSYSGVGDVFAGIFSLILSQFSGSISYNMSFRDFHPRIGISTHL